MISVWFILLCVFSPFSLKALWLFLKKYHRLSGNLFSEIKKYPDMQEFRNKFRNLFLTVLDSGCQNQSGSMIMFWWVPSAWFTASAFYLYPDLLEGAMELCGNFFHENTNLIHEGAQSLHLLMQSLWGIKVLTYKYWRDKNIQTTVKSFLGKVDLTLKKGNTGDYMSFVHPSLYFLLSFLKDRRVNYI